MVQWRREVLQCQARKRRNAQLKKHNQNVTRSCYAHQREKAQPYAKRPQTPARASRAIYWMRYGSRWPATATSSRTAHDKHQSTQRAAARHIPPLCRPYCRPSSLNPTFIRARIRAPMRTRSFRGHARIRAPIFRTPARLRTRVRACVLRARLLIYIFI